MKHASIVALIAVMGIFAAMGSVRPAQAAPPADLVKQVVDYYYEGQNEGPTLVDAKLCKVVHNLECKTALDPGAVPEGETVNVWMQFFVPEDAVYDDIMVEYSHEGVPRRLTPYTIKGSIRYRVVDRHKLNKPGSWKITVKQGTENLKNFELRVVEK